MLGTICVLVTFPFLFLPAIGMVIEGCETESVIDERIPATGASNRTTHFYPECEAEGEKGVTAYYSAFIVLYQVGWAMVQISHLSIIPDITSCANEQMTLTSARFAGTALSNIFLFCVAWIFFHTGT